MSLAEKILKYDDHIQDMDYIQALFAEHPVSAVLDSLHTLLNGQAEPHIDQYGSSDVQSAGLFIRDVILLVPESISGDFRAQLFASPVTADLERLLFSDDYDDRHSAAYALGKIGSTNSIPALHQAFDHFLNDDPLILPDLIFEIRWLQGQIDRTLVVDEPLIDAMVANSHFLVRWSALDVIDRHGCHSDQTRTKLNYLERLRHDENPWLRAEAEYNYQDCLYQERTHNLPKLERRAQHKLHKVEMAPLKPKIDFFGIKIGFLNYLSQNGSQRSFQLVDLEQFFKKLVQETSRA